MHVHTYICMYACMYVICGVHYIGMYICMFVCMYACKYILYTIHDIHIMYNTCVTYLYTLYIHLFHSRYLYNSIYRFCGRKIS